MSEDRTPRQSLRKKVTLGKEKEDKIRTMPWFQGRNGGENSVTSSNKSKG